MKHLPDQAARVHVIRNETLGEEYERTGYLHTVPGVQLGLRGSLDLEAHRNLNEYGGLFPLIPVYGGILIFTSMASLGLPGLGGFISEFLVVRGSWPILTVYTALAMIGLLFTGAYILKGIKMVLHGPMNEKWLGHITEINFREIVVISPLMVLMLWIGVWPAWILNVINNAVLMFYRWF